MGDVHQGRPGDFYRYYSRGLDGGSRSRVSPARREAGDLTVGRMLINACRPFIWRDQFPKSNVFSSEERRIVETKWRDLLEKAAKKRSAWLGVS